MRKGTLVAVVTLALVGSAGLAVAAYAGQSVWGDANPGQALTHAQMPTAGLEHNQAGAEHPPADAGAPDALPDQASDEADTHYPPEHPQA